MTALHLDHNIARDTGVFLQALGHDVSTAQRGGLSRAGDDEHLLVAAQQGRVVVTHNRSDFYLLHDAWRRWSDAWGINFRHAGILVMSPWQPQASARELDKFLRSGVSLLNELYDWKPSRGWVRRP